MFGVQVGIILLICIIFSWLVLGIFRDFGVQASQTKYLLFPLLLFSLGFVLRLSQNKPLIDLGYFLTEFSTLFVTVLFTAFLFLGQMKYWKK